MSCARAAPSRTNCLLSAIDSITVDDLLAEAGRWPISRPRAILAVSLTLHNLLAELGPDRAAALTRSSAASAALLVPCQATFAFPYNGT